MKFLEALEEGRQTAKNLPKELSKETAILNQADVTAIAPNL